jgi:tRNA dimethylallyltransferase
MIQMGLVDEVKNLLPFRNANALQTVGYREMFEHLDGSVSLEKTIEKIAQHTRNYAKRQMTWFRRYPEMVWIKPGETAELFQKIDRRLTLSEKS